MARPSLPDARLTTARVGTGGRASAGGALDIAAYQACIDGFAAGIGDRPATVIVSPDGLGIIPHYTTLDGVAEWCQPAEVPVFWLDGRVCTS